MSNSNLINSMERFKDQAKTKTFSDKIEIITGTDLSGNEFSFKMFSVTRKDQVVNMAVQNGWNKFEEPLPDFLGAAATFFGGSIVDVGANTGYYGLIAAAINNNTRIYAFEPYQKVYSILVKNINTNTFQDRISAMQTAVSDRSGLMDLYIPDDSHGLIETSASLNSDFKKDHINIVKVPTTSLDVFFKNVKDISVIKIDVEGAEKAVLAGGEKTINRNRPIIFIELLPKAEFEYFSEFIRVFNYIDFRLQPLKVIKANNIIFDEHAWNHTFVPSEKMHAFNRIINELKIDYIEE